MKKTPQITNDYATEIAYNSLAQMVARDIRIVEVRGSTPLCSTQNLADQRLQGFLMPSRLWITLCKSCAQKRAK